MNKTILVTGGAGFIGSAVVRYIIDNTEFKVVNLDKLTYAGNLDSLKSVSKNSRYKFEHADICNKEKVQIIFDRHQPDIVMHLAAESHVDRSIDGPSEFIQTNIFGTYILLEVTRNYLTGLNDQKKCDFRFHHVSTDEVFGDLCDRDQLFTEDTPYAPSSPYSASKASSDHLVRAWSRTFDIPVLVTNCSNNYGPFQFPEKLIPLVIKNILNGNEIPIYGNGKQIRDWLYVDDHAKALLSVALKGNIGETYNIGGHNEKQNIEVVTTICKIMDELLPSKIKGIDKYEQLIKHVDDRSGHDIRYAIDASKMQKELNWKPDETFKSGIKKTISWYLDNADWFDNKKSIQK